MQFATKRLDSLFRPIATGVHCLQGDMLLSAWKRRAIAVKRFEHGRPVARSKSFLDDIPIPQNATDRNGDRGIGIWGMVCCALHHSGCLSLAAVQRCSPTLPWFRPNVCKIKSRRVTRNNDNSL